MTAGLARRLRVLVADDHPSVRESLRYLIDAEADLKCVGVVRDGWRCVELCGEIQPDVLVLDHNMPGADGVSVTRTLDRLVPNVRVVMYTLDEEICPVAHAFGAAACVTKDAPHAALLRAIRAAGAIPSVARH